MGGEAVVVVVYFFLSNFNKKILFVDIVSPVDNCISSHMKMRCTQDNKNFL